MDCWPTCFGFSSEELRAASFPPSPNTPASLGQRAGQVEAKDSLKFQDPRRTIRTSERREGGELLKLVDGVGARQAAAEQGSSGRPSFLPTSSQYRNEPLPICPSKQSRMTFSSFSPTTESHDALVTHVPMEPQLIGTLAPRDRACTQNPFLRLQFLFFETHPIPTGAFYPYCRLGSCSPPSLGHTDNIPLRRTPEF